jgi:hypothetical protein
MSFRFESENRFGFGMLESELILVGVQLCSRVWAVEQEILRYA